MKIILFVVTILMLFSSLFALQQVPDMHDNNKVLCCALCCEPIEQGGCCAKFLNKLFCRMRSVRCPIPNCVVICHPSCLQQHLENVHHAQDCDGCISNPCNVALSVLEVSVCLSSAIVAITAGCVVIGAFAYPLYVGGRMVFGSWVDAPFVVWLGYEVSDSMVENMNQRLRVFARVAGALWGVSSGAFDIWLYNTRNSA